jgi:hypothetical protein
MVCAKPLRDVALNKSNHKICIDEANLGPANPDSISTAFWKKKSDIWNVSVAAAHEMLCGNCAHLLDTTEIKDCMKKYPQPSPDEIVKGWVDTNESAGYCDEWEIPCTLTRTCDTWEPGGPITDGKKRIEED